MVNVWSCPLFHVYLQLTSTLTIKDVLIFLAFCCSYWNGRLQLFSLWMCIWSLVNVCWNLIWQDAPTHIMSSTWKVLSNLSSVLAINTGEVFAVLDLILMYSALFTGIREPVRAGTELFPHFRSTSVSGLVHSGRLWLHLLYPSRQLHDLGVLSVGHDWCGHPVMEAHAGGPSEKCVAHKAQCATHSERHVVNKAQCATCSERCVVHKAQCYCYGHGLRLAPSTARACCCLPALYPLRCPSWGCSSWYFPWLLCTSSKGK